MANKPRKNNNYIVPIYLISMLVYCIFTIVILSSVAIAEIVLINTWINASILLALSIIIVILNGRCTK